ncbi:hypothetical protein [Methyloglobulus sp.]|uniref:hypothetical protein n=1 Tax=Methyloglobulus sp. TaxID=2518622 RepID=UPI00398A0E5A
MIPVSRTLFTDGCLFAIGKYLFLAVILADKLVEGKPVASISDETVRQTSKKRA